MAKNGITITKVVLALSLIAGIFSVSGVVWKIVSDYSTMKNNHMELSNNFNDYKIQENKKFANIKAIQDKQASELQRRYEETNTQFVKKSEMEMRLDEITDDTHRWIEYLTNVHLASDNKICQCSCADLNNR